MLLRLQLAVAVHAYVLTSDIAFTLESLLPFSLQHNNAVEQLAWGPDYWLSTPTDALLIHNEGDPEMNFSCAWFVASVSSVLSSHLARLHPSQAAEAAPDLVWTALEEDVGFVLGSLVRRMKGAVVERKQWTPHGQAVSFVMKRSGEQVWAAWVPKADTRFNVCVKNRIRWR